MSTGSYLISVTSSPKNRELALAIINIIGIGQVLYGKQDANGGTELWIIPRSKKERQELTRQLQAVTTIQSVYVVPLSIPVQESELIEVRALFSALDLDSGDVSNEDLSLFLNAKLQNQHTYYIDLDQEKKRNSPARIRIRLLQDHPEFSPSWLKKTENAEDETQNPELTIHDIKTQTVTIEQQVIEEPPPPPPQQPHNLKEMSDKQIIEWTRKNVTSHLQNGIIEIKRTPKEIFITFILGEQSETIIYSLKK